MEVTRIEHFLRKALDYMEHRPDSRIDVLYLGALIDQALGEVDALTNRQPPRTVNTDVCWGTKSVIDAAEHQERVRR